MGSLQEELRNETRQELERKRLALFEIRKNGDRKADRRYAQLTETIDTLDDARKRMKTSRRKPAK